MNKIIMKNGFSRMVSRGYLWQQQTLKIFYLYNDYVVKIIVMCIRVVLQFAIVFFLNLSVWFCNFIVFFSYA